MKNHANNPIMTRKMIIASVTPITTANEKENVPDCNPMLSESISLIKFTCCDFNESVTRAEL
jgi:hypothetical protein